MSHRMSGMAPAQFCVPSESVLLSRLREHRTTRFSKLCRLFRTKTDADESRLLDVLERLEKKGRVSQKQNGWQYEPSIVELDGHYAPLRRHEPGVALEANALGLGRVVLEGAGPFLLPGDRIRVRLDADACTRSRRDGKQAPIAELSEVLALNNEAFPVILHRVQHFGKKFWDGIPLEPAMGGPFQVTGVPPVLAEGTAVLARPVDRNPGQPVRLLNYVETFGDLDTVAMQERFVRLRPEVPGPFPDAVQHSADSLPSGPSAEDMASRRDLRDFPFVTIDGDTAKDFDDAICVERAGNGFLLRVAIADVSQYVRPGTPMDKEALRRGNSWYFPTSVEPMLPEALSNGLCSLNPQTDRLVLWAEVSFDSAGIPGRTDFGAGVIQSFARLTYDGVRDVLLNQDQAAMAVFEKSVREPQKVLGMLSDALVLYRLLRKVRSQRGSLDFDLPEPSAEFDAEGHVERLFRAQRHDIHRLIEEFMIAANEAVARRIEASGIDFLYRVHPAPEKEKLEILGRSLSSCGLFFPRKKGSLPNLREILLSASGEPFELTVNRLCLRAMPQARYARINVGHFGLASRSYCHFTSPIRRYADLLVHRALKHVLGLDGGMFPVGERLDRVADGLNQQERNAMDCEREMDKRLACLWMKRQDTDAVWSGTVSSVLSFGLFVELDAAPVEGLVSLPSLGGDWFEYDERRQRLVGEMTGVVWQVGTPLAVRCVRADPASLQVDFMPASNGDAAKQRAVDRPRLSRGRKKSGRTRSGCSTSVLPYGKRPKGGRKDSCRKDRVGKRTRGKPHLEAENSCSAVAGRAAKTPDLAVSKSRRNKDVAARGKKARRRSGYAASEVEEFIRQLDASDKN